MSRLGIDPEFALIHSSSGKGRSAHLFMGVGADGVGAENKIVTYEKTQIGAEMDRDGTNLEVRSLAPTACRDNLVPYVAEAMRQTQLKLEEWNGGKYYMSTRATYELDLVSFKNNPPQDVVEWGCRPDVDAYTLTPKQPDPPNSRQRFTGGHLHLSNIKTEINNIRAQAAVAVVHDYFIGLPLVAILGEEFASGEAERRKYYGQAGSFRFNIIEPKEKWDSPVCKLEYRVLSGRIMLSPILLTWAMGIQRCFLSHLYAVADYESLLFDVLQKKVKPSTVAKVINEHDVAGARELYKTIFPLFPNYGTDGNALKNTLAGGGGSTRDVFFYEKMVDLFVAANDEGLVWKDDIKHNWGLYENYRPTHHAYWAIGVASVGLTDDTIFPQRPILERIMPAEVLAKKPVYTHPLHGGDKKYVVRGAANWLL